MVGPKLKTIGLIQEGDSRWCLPIAMKHPETGRKFYFQDYEDFQDFITDFGRNLFGAT